MMVWAAVGPATGVADVRCSATCIRQVPSRGAARGHRTDLLTTPARPQPHRAAGAGARPDWQGEYVVESGLVEPRDRRHRDPATTRRVAGDRSCARPRTG